MTNSGKALGRKTRCRYPGCNTSPRMTWALVPLCVEHWENIKIETNRFYKRGNSRNYEQMRPHYLKIAHLTPWGYAGPKPEYEADIKLRDDSGDTDG